LHSLLSCIPDHPGCYGDSAPNVGHPEEEESVVLCCSNTGLPGSAAAAAANGSSCVEF
jgi:hypothetical protein